MYRKMNHISQKWLCEFIDIYKECTILWSPSAIPNNKEENICYEKLIKKMIELSPDGDKSMVDKKLDRPKHNMLRTIRKVKKDENYVPTQLYFLKMSFILSDAEKESISKCLEYLKNRENSIPPSSPKKKPVKGKKRKTRGTQCDIEFIDLLKSNPILWKPLKKIDLKIRDDRKTAIAILLSKLKEEDNNAKEKDVTTKIRYYKRTFKMEMEKMKINKNHVPHYWFFERILFLADNEDI